MKRKVPNNDGNGEDLGSDESGGLNQELNQEGFDVHSPGEVVAVESGKSRVAMRVNARVDTLRVALLLDDADEPDFDNLPVSHSNDGGADFGKARVNLGCVAEARVSHLVANVSLYPSTLAAKFTLGSLTMCDPRLPATHPYRWAVSGGGSNVGSDSRILPDSSADASDSLPLVEVAYETFDPGAEHDGATASASARLRPTRVVLLNRFIAEGKAFVAGLTDAIAAIDKSDHASVNAGNAGSVSKETESNDATKPTRGTPVHAIRLDVALEAPTIVVPRATWDTSVALELDFGSLVAKNLLSKRVLPGGGNEVVDRLNVGLSGVHVDAVRSNDATTGGVTRTPLMRAPASVDAVVWRVLSAGRSPGDSSHSPPSVKVSSEGGDSSIDVPDLAVDADIAPLRLDLSAEDYRLLTTCFTDNTDERPAAIPKTTNPVDASRFALNQSSKFDQSLDRSQPFTRRTSTYATTKSAFTDTGAALLTLEEDHLDGTEDGGLDGLDGEGEGEGEVAQTNTWDRQTRPGRGAAAIRAACAARGFIPDGPTRVASRISIAASVVELSLFRGDGRHEPLASLAVCGTFLFIFGRAI